MDKEFLKFNNKKRNIPAKKANRRFQQILQRRYTSG